MGPSRGWPVRLTGSFVPGGQVRRYHFAPEGSRVVYLADQDADEVLELFSVPIDGHAPSVKLNAGLAPGGDVQTDFQISHDGQEVVYRADQEVDDVFQLYRVAIDGTSAPSRLNDSLVPGGDVQGNFPNFGAFSLRGDQVVYRADQESDEIFGIYSVPLDGGRGALRESGPMAQGGDVTLFELSADAGRVVYLADQDTDEVFELYMSIIAEPHRRANAPTTAVERQY